MSNQQKIGLVIGLLLVMAVIVWLFGKAPEGERSGGKQVVSADWKSQYEPFGKDPLDLYLFNRMIQAHLDTNHHIKIMYSWEELDSIRQVNKGSNTYYYVGEFGLLNKELEGLLEDVQEGSKMFLAYPGNNKITDNILDAIFEEYYERSDYADSIRVFAGKRSYDMINIYQNDTIACDWVAFGDIETTQGYNGLSSFMDMCNFIKIPYGHGSIYMHTTPQLFYNYQLKRRDGFRYASYVINKLPKDQDVLWMQFGKLPEDYDEEEPFEELFEEKEEDESFLAPLLRNPYLTAALLLSIAGVILFIMFRTKRMRPIVPFMEEKKDMTLAFAETITSIYFAKRNPYGILQIQRQNFYSLIQKHFFIDLQRRDTDKAIISLAEKSNKSVDEIKELLAQLETTQAGSVNEQYIAELDKKKRKFYREVGILSDKTIERVKTSMFMLRRSLLLPLLMILGGIGLILMGFYYLVIAVGVGITLWPAGILLLLLGIIRLSTPIMKITEDEFIFYNGFGIRKKFRAEDLVQTMLKSQGVVMEFTENRKLIINFWDLSSFDRKRFEQLVTKLQMNEL